MNALIAAASTVAAIVLFALMARFVLMNLLVQCESWAQPECITPMEFLEIYMGRFTK